MPAHRIVRQLALGVDGASHEAEDPLAEGHRGGPPDSGLHRRRKAHGSAAGLRVVRHSSVRSAAGQGANDRSRWRGLATRHGHNPQRNEFRQLGATRPQGVRATRTHNQRTTARSREGSKLKRTCDTNTPTDTQIRQTTQKQFTNACPKRAHLRGTMAPFMKHVPCSSNMRCHNLVTRLQGGCPVLRSCRRTPAGRNAC